MQVYKFTATKNCNSASLQVTSLQVTSHKFTSVQIYKLRATKKIASLQVYTFTNIV